MIHLHAKTVFYMFIACVFVVLYFSGCEIYFVRINIKQPILSNSSSWNKSEESLAKTSTANLTENKVDGKTTTPKDVIYDTTMTGFNDVTLDHQSSKYKPGKRGKVLDDAKINDKTKKNEEVKSSSGDMIKMTNNTIHCVSSECGPCPQGPILSAVDANGAAGRLGNDMGWYANVWALAKLKGLQGYISERMLHSLKEYFEGISLPSLKTVKHCNLSIEMIYSKTALKFVQSKKMTKANETPVIIENCIDPAYFQLFPTDILREFAFKKSIQEKANLVLKKVMKGGGTNVTLIGMHVRRSDYFTFFKHLPVPTVNFYNRAMKYYQQIIPNPHFLIVSDDMKWCRENIIPDKNVHLVGNPEDIGQDLAVLANCNHSIFSYGTFGFWGSYLAGGMTVHAAGQDYAFDAAKSIMTWKAIPTQI